MLTPSNALSYRISKTDNILVISLMGELTRSDQRTVRKIINEVHNAQATAVVLNLLEVQNIEQIQLPDFAKLQAAVRRKQARLRLCALKPSLEIFLTEMGLLRSEEVFDDLKAALISLIGL